jgi:hypothetical protein
MLSLPCLASRVRARLILARALGTRERYIFGYLIGIADKNVLEVRTASEKGPRELAEVKRRLELAEQPRLDETMQKQALREAFETEKNILLNEIVMLRKRAATVKSRLTKWRKRSEFKGRAEPKIYCLFSDSSRELFIFKDE